MYIGEDVTGGKVKLNTTIDNVSMLTQDLDLCDTIDQVDLECPLKKGSHMAAISEDLPDVIPPVSPLPHHHASSSIVLVSFLSLLYLACTCQLT